MYIYTYIYIYIYIYILNLYIYITGHVPAATSELMLDLLCA